MCRIVAFMQMCPVIYQGTLLLQIREATARMEDYPPAAYYGYPQQHKVYLSNAELVRRARAAALAKWSAQTHASLEACFADPRLPPSLHLAVHDCWTGPVQQQQQQA